MSENSQIFKAKTAIKAADLEHRRKINFNISKYNEKLPEGKSQFPNTQLAIERTKNKK